MEAVCSVHQSEAHIRLGMVLLVYGAGSGLRGPVKQSHVLYLGCV